MTNAVNTISLPGNAPPQAQSNTAASTLVNSNQSNNADTKPLVGNSNTPISPRIVVDPLAGVITQFLSTDGQVQSQIPSAAVVAYLRAGLTSNGQTKPSPETQQENDQANNSVVA